MPEAGPGALREHTWPMLAGYPWHDATSFLAGTTQGTKTKNLNAKPKLQAEMSVWGCLRTGSVAAVSFCRPWGARAARALSLGSCATAMGAVRGIVRERSEIEASCSDLEDRVQLDEGGRGIGEFLCPGDLATAAVEVARSDRVAILTGFPCNLDHDVKQETDGPLGSVALAVACRACGVDAVILTDDCNAGVLRASVAGSDVEVLHFPPGSEWTASEQARLVEIASSVDHVIAVERSGPNRAGQYQTMSGRNMTHLLAPLERLLPMVHARGGSSTGIGDGGNELGMGKVIDRVEASGRVRDGIACVAPARNLITCSVSNWGAYALAAALGVATRRSDTLPSDASELRSVNRIVSAGARDGVTGRQEPTVDGMDFEATLSVLRDLRAIVEKSNERE